MDITKQNIIITGGANGIGRQLVMSLKDQAQNLIVIDKDEEGIKEQSAANANVDYYRADLTDYSEVGETVDQIYNEFEEINVLVNNAGLIHSEPLVNLMSRENPRHDLDSWNKTIDTNLNSVFYITSHLAEKMTAKRHKGVIINISSVSSSGMAGQSAYSASKAAIDALTKTWSQELGMFGIRCNAIAPGFFDTESTDQALSDSKIKEYVKQTPAQRLGDPREIANAIEFIIENDFYNGSILNLDGGFKA